MWKKPPKRSAFRSRRFTATGDWPNRGCCAGCAERSRMNPERWKQIEGIYHAALEREPGERGTFLDQACTGDEELRREVTSLLDYDNKPASFIEAPVLEVAARELAGDSLSGAPTPPPDHPAQTRAPTPLPPPRPAR